MQNKPDIDKVRAVLPGNVILRNELGEGGFKVAYRAEVDGVIEAVKIVHIPVDLTDATVEEENRRRLRREIDILSRCASACIVKLGQFIPIDCLIDCEQFVIYSEELVEGQSLRQIIKAGHIPSDKELASLGVSLISVIAELENLNTIHRDIKPDNVVKTLDPRRPFVLLDLGIAFVVGGTNLTRDPLLIPGTRPYLAPEMLDFDFRTALDYRADLYTIGLTLYEYASGINPFSSSGDPLTTLYRIKHINPEPLSRLRNDLDKNLCALVDQLMKKLPALRPANLALLLKRMEAYK
ncbi:MAG: serine/threonine-protein kinase [bacterium]|nr:serine/threonine-protein kinase [bacterium]